MRRWIRIIWIVLCLASVQALATPTPLVIVYADYKPYSWEEGGKAMGLEIEILNEAIGKRMGIPITHQILPWERAQQNVKAGVADAFVATASEQRASYADASATPVTYWELALYIRKGDARFANLKHINELSPFRMGSMIGNGWAQTHLAGMDVYYVGKMEQLPKMLLLGRIDAIPDNPLVMRRILKAEHDDDKVDELPLPYLRKDMFLYVGKQSAFRRQLDAFNAVMLQMKRDGSLQRMHDRYKGMVTGKDHP